MHLCRDMMLPLTTLLSKIMLIHENVRTFCASMLIYCNKFYLLGFVPKIEYIHAMRNPMSHFSIEKKNENHASFLSKIIMNALTFLCAIPLPFMECCTNKYNTPKNQVTIKYHDKMHIWKYIVNVIPLYRCEYFIFIFNLQVCFIQLGS